MARASGIDRARVVAVAAELADNQGLAAVSMSLIAERLGIRTPSLYNHIAGLAGLRRELALLGMRQLAERLGAAIMGWSGDSAVHALAVAYRSYVLAHPGVYATTVEAPPLEDHELQSASAQLLAVVKAALAAYHLGEAELLHVTRGLRSLIHGFATLEAAGGFGLPLDHDESFRLLVAVFVSGLRD
ncbi:MAG: WHG domain-containing protein [Roseiflexaceae bacterium]|nr:WHG domain-containing protein [Roseiflexaceae bacterium]